MVERLVPDELWQLIQRVMPQAPTRPQGGGRRRYGDREVLAAIVFVATTGCTWRQLPPVFDGLAADGLPAVFPVEQRTGVGQAAPGDPG
jgi:hypothetical protein